MARTNWQDPKTSEIISPHISGLQEAVGKIEDILDMQVREETGVALSEVYIADDDRYRIYQAPEGKRNWASSPAPIIKKNGTVITSGFEIDYGGGAVVFTTSILETDVLTADAKCTSNSGKIESIETAIGDTSELETESDNLVGAVNEVKSDLDSIELSAETMRFVIGSSTAGWTDSSVDYLCNGVNDHIIIQEAIDNLPATGGEVVILDGTYSIGESINIPYDNVVLRGNGNATILKRMYDSTLSESGPTAKGLITLNEKSGCKIVDLQIDGNKDSYANSNNYGIYLSSSNNNTITGNTCNNNGYGINLTSSNNNTVTGNTCNNNGSGISLYSSSDNTVTGNTCNNNSNYEGIYLSSSNNNTITGNTCNNNGYGINLTSSNNNTVTGNTCNNNGSGIRLYTSSNNTVTGNTCIRGTGLSTDYTVSQHTIRLHGMENNYNLISNNNCMGKAVTNEGGTGNTLVNNKFDAS